ncbi:putative late blight resistance protein R1A-4 [Salvia divinorum]|uniref:Late blight resistance protein R1A-4 n=1 Tax=Salvia divinorum TaxID=28513 RepID=A0ABD1HL82_SALDI
MHCSSTRPSDPSSNASCGEDGSRSNHAKHRSTPNLDHRRPNLPSRFCPAEKVGKEIESVSEQLMVIKNSIITVEDGLLGGGSAIASSSSTVALIRKEAMVGFDGLFMEIKSRLCGEPSSPLKIIPVVGMGGIGKTTLALNAYDDPLTMERFQIRAWVTVSQDYSVQEIASGLLASMEAPKLVAQRNSMKQHHVFQKLKCRRFLIVLDDVWSRGAWNELRMMFLTTEMEVGLY